MSAYDTFGQAFAHWKPIDYAFQAAPYALALTAIAGPDSRFLRAAIYLPAIYLTAYLAQTEHRLGIMFYDYFASIFALCIVVRATDLLLIRHAEDLKRHGQPAPAFSKAPIQKLKWAIDLMLNLRGIGWDWQVVKRPSRPFKEGTTRFQFLTRQARDIFLSFLLCDACHAYGHSQEYFKSYPSASHPRPPLLSYPFPVILINAFVPTLFIYGILSILHMIVSVIVVAGINASPTDWPPAFGPPTASTSVRKFWGATWHQELRAIFTMPAFAVAYIFGISVHTPLMKTVIGISAFVVSACLHLFPALLTPAPEGTFPNRGWDSATFFVLQPAAIALELTVQALNKQLVKRGLSPFGKRKVRKTPKPEGNGHANGDASGNGEANGDVKGKGKAKSDEFEFLPTIGSRAATIIGAIWTWTWLIWSGIYFITDLCNMGVFEFAGKPVSVMRLLAGGPLLQW